MLQTRHNEHDINDQHVLRWRMASTNDRLEFWVFKQYQQTTSLKVLTLRAGLPQSFPLIKLKKKPHGKWSMPKTDLYSSALITSKPCCIRQVRSTHRAQNCIFRYLRRKNQCRKGVHPFSFKHLLHKLCTCLRIFSNVWTSKQVESVDVHNIHQFSGPSPGEEQFGPKTSAACGIEKDKDWNERHTTSYLQKRRQ